MNGCKIYQYINFYIHFAKKKKNHTGGKIKKLTKNKVAGQQKCLAYCHVIMSLKPDNGTNDAMAHPYSREYTVTGLALWVGGMMLLSLLSIRTTLTNHGWL